jgi:xylose isomerase
MSDLISTSYVERLNATTRLHMRRLTRLTLAFSKKRENFEAAVALHFAYYNFVHKSVTTRCAALQQWQRALSKVNSELKISMTTRRVCSICRGCCRLLEWVLFG